MAKTASIAPRLGNANIQRMHRMRKMTFRLDAETLELVNGLARRWKVSKSEAVRRALNQAHDGRASNCDRRLGRNVLAAAQELQRR